PSNILSENFCNKMRKNMEQKVGYRMITYRFRLYCSREELLLYTNRRYNEVLRFYYDILMKETELAGMSRYQISRQLELLSIGARGEDSEATKYPFPYGKVPLYFRRAAINDAIRLHRSYLTGKENGAKPAEEFHASPIYYKGMYKNLTDESVCLKLFDGERWIWEECRLDTCGREFPKEEAMLSPVIKGTGRRAMLHIPVREPVQDVRTVKERMQTEERICAMSFPGGDCFAVLAVLGKDGTLQETKFIRGGDKLLHERQKLVSRMKRNRISMGGDLSGLEGEEHKHLKEKIHHLTEDATHKVSHEIAEFCESRNIRILVVPDYRQNTINMNTLGYLTATNYDWLGRRIISYLKYKAFGKGMVVTGVSRKDISRTCHICGEQVKKYNEGHAPSVQYYGGRNFICPNGHQGNSHLNSAINAGLKFLKSQAEMQE
ncbi:MAG: zinc ribbon domain-containing protein, partial [Lachnospiraceae bacterium]